MNPTPAELEKWNAYDVAGIGSGGYTDLNLLRPYVRGSVLELGCGRGDLLASLGGAQRRVGVDLSERAIYTAQKNHLGVEFIVGDVCSLPFPDSSFDLVYSIEVIEHIAKPSAMLAEAKRLLKPGGTLFIQTPNYPIKRAYDYFNWLRGLRESSRDDYTHISPLSASELRDAVTRQFELIAVRTRNILGERKLPFLENVRKSGIKIGLLFGQKTIVVARKFR